MNTEAAATRSSPRRPRGFARWIAANVGSAVPLSMAPITFGLATLSQGDLHAGALMMTAMTVAQVVGAVPIAAAGRRFSVTAYARVLTGFRTLAFVGLVLAIAAEAPVSGPGGRRRSRRAGQRGDLRRTAGAPERHGGLDQVAARAWGRCDRERTRLRDRADPGLHGRRRVGRRGGQHHGAHQCTAPRGVAAHRASHAGGIDPPPEGVGPPSEGVVRPATVVWLLAAASASACVASIEVGALALALRHELAPGAAFLFTVPLCVGSVLGGVWISVRNRRLRQRTVVVMMLLTVVGMLAVAWDAWIGSALAGVVLIGVFLAPLGTSFSLLIDDVLPPTRRPEGFALLRTSKSVGLITASSVIAFGSLAAAFLVSAGLAAVSAIIVALHARSVGRR